MRLFTFGVGYDVNTALLDRLAAENGGVADYIDEVSFGQASVAPVYRGTQGNPVLFAASGALAEPNCPQASMRS